MAAAAASYTTVVTWVLDVGIIAPSARLAGALVHRGRPFGYLLGTFMVLLNVTIGVGLLGQSVAQLALGVPATLGHVLGMMFSFAISTLVALVLAVVVLRSIDDSRV